MASLLARVDERGSAYFPEVNAFYVREFQLMHAAEDAARFLHHACRGLPRRLHGPGSVRDGADSDNLSGNESAALPPDAFFTQVIENCIAYFGSRVLYPPGRLLRRRALLCCHMPRAKSRFGAIRADEEMIESVSREWGYWLGSMLYDAYLAGRATPSGLRRLFLAHLDEPGIARKVCKAVIAKVRRGSRSRSSKAQASAQMLL